MSGYSPGRRLSHLAKRKSTFSSESLHAICKAKTFGIEKKTILVDAKYVLMLVLTIYKLFDLIRVSFCSKDKKNKVVKRALFHTADEIKSRTDVKSSSSKLKSMQLRHSLWLRKRTPKKGTPRKTPLKQTPKKPTPKKHVTPKKRNTPKKVGEPVRNFEGLKLFTDKAYQTAVSENGKRLRLDDNATDGKIDCNVSELSDTQRRVNDFILYFICFQKHVIS